MRRKIVNDGEMVFLDDVVIHDEEISRPLGIPEPPVFSENELTIFYGGQVYRARDHAPAAGDHVKVYTQTYALETLPDPGEQESAWFAGHGALIAQLQRDFIVRSVEGVGSDGTASDLLGRQISTELLERIRQRYAGGNRDKLKVIQAVHQDHTVFGTLEVMKQALVVDGKIYNLITPGEYLGGFEKAFEPGFFKSIIAYSKTAQPEEIARQLDANREKINARALFFVRDKIWNGNTSFELYVGGTYFVPHHAGEAQPIIDEYASRLGEKIKLLAAEAYK